jgi:tetratricopeptide (TPR) repeat protein
VLGFAALLVVAAVWAYSTSFGGVLVLDDVRAIERNPTITALWPLSIPLSPPTGSTVAGRPVANLTFAINYALAPADVRDVFTPGGPSAPGGGAPFLRNIRGYHLANLLIHIAAGLVLFGIVRRTLVSAPFRRRFAGAATWLAFAVSLVWVVHPLQTESVTYIVQRVESLAGLFYLLTLYCAIRAIGEPDRRLWTIAAILACALGMATKEVMVTAPILVWLWARTFSPDRSRRIRPLVAGLPATWIVLGVLVLHEHRVPSVELGGATVWRYLLTQTAVVAHYLRLAIVPSPLVFLYTWPLATSFGSVAAQAVLIVALAGLSVFGLVRRHPLGFAGVWFFLILAPTSTALPIVTEVAAEHRMYLPLASFVACVVVGVYLAGGRVASRFRSTPHGSRRAATGVALLLALVAAVGLGTTTRARNLDYSSAERLWQDTVRKQPDNQRARVAYAEALANAGRLEEAEAQYRAAVQLAPADATALARLGGVLAARGKLDEAIEHFERALTSRPGDLDADRGLGLAYAARSQDALALPHLERALAAQPGDVAVLGQFATILADSRDLSLRDGPRAVDLAERAVRLTSRHDPTSLEILSVALASVDRYADAAAAATEALAIARRRGNQALAARLEYRANAYRVMGGRD